MRLSFDGLFGRHVSSILEKAQDQSTVFSIDFLLRSKGNDSVNIEVDFIDALRFSQDFHLDYSDVNEIIIRVTPQDYIQIAENKSDLLGYLTFKYHDNKTQAVDLKKPGLKKEFIAVPLDVNDPAKMTDIRELVADKEKKTRDHHEMLIPMSIQLVEKKLYELRHFQFNGIFKNATVKDVIGSIVGGVGFESCDIVSPDNKTSYRNFVIPPDLSFSDLIDFIHARYGVYWYGCNFYVTDNRFYLYPPLKLDLHRTRPIHIYNVSSNMLAGMSAYHTRMQDELHLVSNSETVVDDVSTRMAENVGDAYMFYRPDKMIDSFKYDTEQGTQIVQDKVIMGSGVAGTHVKERINVSYLSKATNPFVESGRQLQNAFTHVLTQWSHAEVFSISPGHQVSFNYETADKTRAAQGQCDGVIYDIKPSTRLGSKQLFSSMATISLRLES